MNSGITPLYGRDFTTCIRGLAVLLIAIFHVLLEWDGMPRYINLTGSVCVATFLFFSGYGIHESYKKNGLQDYWHKRFKRIILPYTLFITLLIPFTSDYNLKEYLLDITYIHSSYWFIEFLVWNYIIYWIAQKYFSKYLFTIFLLFAIFGVNFLMQMEAEQVLSFPAGILLSKHIDSMRLLSKKYLVLLATGCFVFGSFFLLLKEIPTVHAYKGSVAYNYILLMIKLPMGITLSLIPLFIPFVLRSRLLYLCGVASLEIYLVHLALLPLAQQQPLSLLLFILLNIILVYVLYKLDNVIISRL